MTRAGRPSPAARAPARAAAKRDSSVEILSRLATTKAATMTARTIVAAAVALMLAGGHRDARDAGEGPGRAHVPADAAFEQENAPRVAVPAALVGVDRPPGDGGQLGHSLVDRRQADVLEHDVDR